MEKDINGLRTMAGIIPGWGDGPGPMGDIIATSLAANGNWSTETMRAPGFRRLEAMEMSGLNGFRAAAPMIDKAQVVIDRAVVEVGLQRLTITADIMAAGLTYNLADPLSVAQLEWSTITKTGAAQRTMTPDARGERKMPVIAPTRLPIYLTTDNFDIDIRTLRNSQRVGMPLDTTLVKQCVRSVNEAIEDATINGATTLDGQALFDAGYSAPGLLNAPNAATKTNLTAAAWTTVPVGSTVFNETMAMIALLQANNRFGPYNMYVPTQVGNALDADFNATNNAQGLTIRQRLLQISSLQKVSVADLLPVTTPSTGVGAKIVLMQMTSDIVDIVVGQPPTVIPWTSANGFQIFNLVMAIMIPRVKYDAANKSGICIGTTA